MQVLPIKVSDAQQIDLSKYKPINLNEMAKKLDFSSFDEFLKDQKGSGSKTYNNPIDPDHPLNQPYAQINIRGKNGQTVTVEIDNNGFMRTPNNFQNQTGISIDMIASWSSASGPELAKTRADKLAELTGGSIELASTAVTNPNLYPKTFTYSRAELDDMGFNSLVDSLKLDLAKQTYYSSKTK